MKGEIEPKVPSAPVDFAIITALEEERDAMLSKFSNYKKLDKESDDIYTYYFTEVLSKRNDKAIYKVVVVCPINMGPINATALGVTIAKKWEPKYVLLVGIACGVKNEVAYGDVMIATQIADYTLGKYEDVRKIRWEVSPGGSSLLDSANNLDNDWIEQIIKSRPRNGKVKKIKGVIASGGDVISNDDIIKSYSESWPKLIGIEMESGGVAAGLHRTPERPEFLMIKSVSDFGKDKHDPKVKPWRDYACHVAAAFAFELIRSGPSQSIELLTNESKETKEKREKKDAAERRWQYLQNHPIVSFEISFFLKSATGYKWLFNLFDDIKISFSRNKAHLKLGRLFKESQPYNTIDYQRKSEKPICSFWEMYEKEEGFWCKRISKKSPIFKLVAGFDLLIPWHLAGESQIRNLQDLAILDEIGIAFPPQIFHAGIEEVIIEIKGETYSFCVFLSDHLPIDMYHEMAKTLHSMSRKNTDPMNFVMGFSGVHILDLFHAQSMPDYKRNSKRSGFMIGQAGPDGNSIYFYPTMPLSFNKTEESEKFSFKVTVPEEIKYDELEKELLESIESNTGTTDEYLKLASIYNVQGRFQDTIKLLKNKLDQLTPHYRLYGLLGSAFGELGRHAEAFEEFKKAALIAPGEALVYNSLGLCQEKLENSKKAFKYFEKAIKLEPGKADYHSNYGRALARANLIKRAITQLRAAIELDTDDIDDICFLSFLLYRDDQLDEALNLSKKSIDIDADFYLAYKINAQILAKKGEVEKAIENFQQSLSLKKDVDCYIEYIKCYHDLKRWEDVENVALEGLAINEDYPELLLYLGVSQINRGLISEGVETLIKVCKLNPEDQRAFDTLKQIEKSMDKLKNG